MAVIVRIPGALRADAGGHSQLEVPIRDGDQSAALGSVLDEVGRRWPLVERRIRDEHGQLRRFVNVYIDGEECRRLAGMATPVTEQSEILVVPSVAGG
jgi:molybdopterin converting factor small subunit